MADYINREKEIQSWQKAKEFDAYEHYSADAIIDSLENAPSIDAVEVVRCRECRFFDSPSKTERGVCTYGRHISGRKMSCSGFGTTINDYCSRGEKE